MASLYNRATPRQAKLLRMIEGACRNAAHAHPGRPLDDRLARGIAKRAAGTITSQWGDALAASRARSDDGSGQGVYQTIGGDSHALTAAAQKDHDSLQAWSGGASHIAWRTPLYRVKLAIGAAAGEARAEGSKDRYEAFQDVLRLLSRVMLADEPPPPQARLKVGKQE